MATYTFGVAKLSDQDKQDWLVQSASTNTTAQEALALNEVGEPVVAHYYQKVDEMTFEVIIPDGVSESDIPAVGDVFEYNGKNWYVSNSQLSATNTDFRRYTLTAKRFVATNLPA